MKNRSTVLPTTALLLTALLLGCSGHGVLAPESAPAPEAGNDIRWVRDAAEYEAAVIQTYRLATRQVERLADGRERGRWAVVMDADETLISNLGYSLSRVAAGGGWSEESWHEWVLAERATALPGAVEFVDRVHELGGRVAVVTNRSQKSCEATGNNLRAVGVRYDFLRCRDGESSKAGRWEEVRSGNGTGLGPLEIVMWIGDNIHDFPGLDQSAKSGDGVFDDFGTRFFVLPNPLYGSWE